MTKDHIRRAAELLVSARRSGLPLTALPDELIPASTDDAYAVQDLVTAQLGPIGGWKIAPAKQGVPFNWAPIPAAGVLDDGAEIRIEDWPRAMLELEICFILGGDLPPRSTSYGREEVVEAIEGMRVCLELFASRYADFTARTAMEKLADAQNASGVVVGSGLTDWRGVDLSLTELTLDYAGRRHAISGGSPLDELLDACTGLANGAGRLGGLRAGHVIITGARIGPIAPHPCPALGVIDPVGAVSATFL